MINSETVSLPCKGKIKVCVYYTLHKPRLWNYTRYIVVVVQDIVINSLLADANTTHDIIYVRHFSALVQSKCLHSGLLHSSEIGGGNVEVSQSSLNL